MIIPFKSSDVDSEFIYVSDIIETLEIIEDEEDSTERDYLNKLLDLLRGKGNQTGFPNMARVYPKVLIRHDYFTEHIKDRIFSEGLIAERATHICRHVDWEAIAEEAMENYKEIDLPDMYGNIFYSFLFES